MRIPARLLLISLLALSLYAQPAQLTPGQQPGTVNVRPRVTAAQPGMPEVKATADRTRVALGDEVTFTLSPAKVLMDPRYKVTLFFGDGGQQVMREPQTVHPYKTTGTYTYSILVEPAHLSTPTPTPLPAVPNVKLSVTPASVEVNRSVSFSAEPSRAFPHLRYRFAFADGSDTGWQAEPYATHAYRAPNAYRPYVDIGIFANGFVKQVGGSERQSIVVTKLGNADGNSNGNKNLNGNRNTNQTGNSNSRNGNTNRPDNSNQSRNGNANIPSNMNGNGPTNVNGGGVNSNINANRNANVNSSTISRGNVNGNASPAASATASETPLVNGPVGPTDWWKYLIIAAIILFAAYQTASYIFVPRPTFVPRFDPGEASVGGQNLAFDLQVDVDPNVDGGDFKIQTEGDSFIKSERSAQ